MSDLRFGRVDSYTVQQRLFSLNTWSLLKSQAFLELARYDLSYLNIKSNKQPATNNQQPTTNNQQQTTNNQQPTTNNQQPTTNNKTFPHTEQRFPLPFLKQIHRNQNEDGDGDESNLSQN